MSSKSIFRALWFPALTLFLLAAAPRSRAQQTFPSFQVRSYMGRCLDFGAPPQVAGAPIFIYNCNGTIAQQVGVQELLPPRNVLARAKVSVATPGIVTAQEAHQVVLHAGTLCLGAKSTPAGAGTPIVLEPCSTSDAQRFYLDGDSMILAVNRNLVIQLQGAITTSRTPLVLSSRQLADTEFWDFNAVDNSGRKPTSVFTTVTTPAALQSALQSAVPGSVIEVNGLLTFPDLASALQVTAGVTLRGDRRGEALGPQIQFSVGHLGDRVGLLETAGDNIRITGLRLRGPGRDPSGNLQDLIGIIVHDENITLIDHNDMSDWTQSAVDDWNAFGETTDCTTQPASRPQHVRVIRNYIHNNEQHGTSGGADGYGLASGHGANPIAEANTFDTNVHSVVGDGYVSTGYTALNNLFLSSSADANGEDGDVDMHGQTGIAGDTHHVGGVGGSGAIVSANTFLGTGHFNFAVRGTPCSPALDTFLGNTSVRGSSGVFWDPAVSPSSKQPAFLKISSKFSAANPTSRLAVGDFDGDGKDDLFMATGSAWYYSPSGNAEWRFLSVKSVPITSLLFGDFDGDGRTDVVTNMTTSAGPTWMVSWGGVSDWQPLSTDHRFSNLANTVVGDFTGDGRADLFYADGNQWWVADAGGTFTPYATSSYKVSQLLFGDFDGDHKTDVAGVVANQWMAVYAKDPSHHWQRLRSKLTDSMTGLFVADFNGDGQSDIARFTPVGSGISSGSAVQLQVSYNGTGDWTNLATVANPSQYIGVGRFDDVPGADLLFWNDNYWQAISAGKGSPQRQSRQDMR